MVPGINTKSEEASRSSRDNYKKEGKSLDDITRFYDDERLRLVRENLEIIKKAVANIKLEVKKFDEYCDTVSKQKI